MQKINNHKLIILLLMLAASNLNAQHSDSLSLIKEFISVCNSYKTKPLQVQINLNRTANYIATPEDTLSGLINIAVNESDSYINMGGTEQIINDSVLVVVHQKFKTIYVYNSNYAKAAGSRTLNFYFADSNIQKMAQRYSATKNTETATGISTIILKGKQYLSGTIFSAENISVAYNTQSSNIIAVKQQTRGLLPLLESEYKKLSANGALQNYLLSIEGKYYLVKEKTMVYQFNKITHEQMPLPATVKSRVKQKTDGGFEPATGYENYRINKIN